jgi:hypothetical protein
MMAALHPNYFSTVMTIESNNSSSPLEILQSQGLNPEWAKHNCQEILERISLLQQARLNDKQLTEILSDDFSAALGNQEAYLQTIESGVQIVLKSGSLEGIDPQLHEAIINRVQALSESDFRAMGTMLAFQFRTRLAEQQEQLNSQGKTIRQNSDRLQDLEQLVSQLNQKEAQLAEALSAEAKLKETPFNRFLNWVEEQKRAAAAQKRGRNSRNPSRSGRSGRSYYNPVD